MLLWLAIASAAAPPVPCATPVTWVELDPVDLPSAPRADGLALRDPYGVPNVRTSDHFAVRWGNERSIGEVEVDRLLGALEDGWDFGVDELAHTRPHGTDEYYFNVYIGDTGDGAPPGRGAAGYYSGDREGWPMIVIAESTFDYGDYLEKVGVHEFYHALQGATNRFRYGATSDSAWFWEATANWAAANVYPENQSYAVFLPAYAFYPHKRLSYFKYPETGAINEYYQYGAFIFPLYLTQQLGTPAPIRDTWEDTGDEPNPIQVLREKVAERGENFDALWLDHVARNVTWDYPDGADYRSIVASWSGYPESENQIAVRLPQTGHAGPVDSRLDVTLERYGSHTLRLDSPLPGTYTLLIDGSEMGNLGNAARWGGTVVIPDGWDRVEYRSIVFDGTHGEIALDDLDDFWEVYVTLGVWTDEPTDKWGVERFHYRYQLAFEPAEVEVEVEDEEPESVGGCSCSRPTSPGNAWLGIPLLVLLGRRGWARSG